MPDLWGTDRWFDEIRLVALDECLRQGRLWPRWLPQLSHGYGYPLFHFYPPGLYLLAWPLHALGLGAREALLVILGGGMFLGAACSTLALLPRVGPRGAALGGLLWATSPYLQVDLQVRHAWPELLGLCLLPLFLWGVLDLAEGRSSRAARLRTAGGLTAILLVHNVVALFAAAAALALAVFVGGRRRAVPTLATTLVAVGLTAFFWLPALVDSDRVHTDRMTQGQYDIAEQATHPTQLIGVDFGRGPSIPGPDDEMSLSMGFAHSAALATVLLLALVRLRRGSTAQRATAAGWVLLTLAMLAILLQLRVAAPLWEWIPLLGHVQAPLRFLGPLGLAAAWAIPLVGARALPERVARTGGWILALAAAALLTPAFGSVRHMTDAERAEIAPVREHGAAGLRDLPDPQAMTTVFFEFLPRSVTVYPAGAPDGLVDAPPGFTIASVDPTCHGWTAEGHAPTPGPLRFHVFDFEGFEAWIDNEPVPHDTGPDGLAVLAIAAPGDFVAELRFEPTPTATWAPLVSVLTLLVLLWWIRREP